MLQLKLTILSCWSAMVLACSRDHHGSDHHDHDPVLSNDSSAFVVGDHRFLSQEEFIRSGHRCGTKRATLEMAQAAADRQAAFESSVKSDKPVQDILIETWVHVITDSTGRGAVNQSTIDDQMNVLNQDYSGKGFQFFLAGTTCSANDAWFTADYTNDREMKTALRQGDAATLNIYLNSPGRGLLGYAAFPDLYISEPDLDGVLCLSETLPGGAADPYNEGKTLSHEVRSKLATDGMDSLMVVWHRNYPITSSQLSYPFSFFLQVGHWLGTFAVDHSLFPC